MPSHSSLPKFEHQPWAMPARANEKAIVSFLTAQRLNPLACFVPNGAQEQLINSVASSTGDTEIPVVLCTFANGVGKTVGSTHILLNLIYGPQNGWFDHELFRNFPFPKVIWYCSTAETIKNTVIPEFEKIAPPGTYESTKEGKPHTAKMTFHTGWTVVFKTYDQDPSTYESANVGVVVADEPMPENLWKAVKSRRRMGAITILPMTPLYCPPYILDEVQAAAEEGKPGYYHLKADIYAACKRRGVRGYLDPQIVDDMVTSYDADERSARAFGEFMYFSGKIYADLSRTEHFVAREDYPIPPGSQLFHVTDPHDTRYSASIWGAVLPNGRRVIFDEYPIDKSRPYWDFKRGKTVDEEVSAWKSVEEKYPFMSGFHVERILDRHFAWQTRGQTNLAQLYAQAGERAKVPMTFISSYKAPHGEGELQYGHAEVRRALKPMSDGKPGLVIWNTCYHVWNGLQHYIRKHETTKRAADRAAGDGKIVEKYKDFPDTVRYFVCAVPTSRGDEDVPMSRSAKKWKKVKSYNRNEADSAWWAN